MEEYYEEEDESNDNPYDNPYDPKPSKQKKVRVVQAP